VLVLTMIVVPAGVDTVADVLFPATAPVLSEIDTITFSVRMTASNGKKDYTASTV
jgi:hypothetical protein